MAANESFSIFESLHVNYLPKILLSIIEFVTLVHSLKSIYKDAFKYRTARKAIYIFSVNRIAATMTIYYIPLGEFASECGKDFSEGSFIFKCGGLYK